jgi:uncharacterized LabA/DUF88 family protein
MPPKTAILIDGGFFVKRYKHICNDNNPDPKKIAKDLFKICTQHLSQKITGKDAVYSELYRIFYYDCVPFDKKHHHPLSKRSIDFSKTEQYKFQTEFHAELKKMRKIALRLGTLYESGWRFRPHIVDKLINRKISIDDITDDDIYFEFRQKQVDMKIGIDIASLTLKKQVNQIILISGDSDFVPAAKLARRDGIDFILDPMWNTIKSDLHEHVDGLRTTMHKPVKKSM